MGKPNIMMINANQKKSKIHKEIYGHFSEHLGHCIYGGLYVGKDSDIPNIDGIRLDVLEALRKIRVPVLRWPGGCFAEEYNWMDGIGDPAKRPRKINIYWGGVIEDNSFGTHEFMRLCELLGCDAYINGNLSGGTVREMSDWVEYLTFDGESTMTRLREENGQDKPWKVRYFGVGNENWGNGGNMRPEYYADEYRKYQTVTRSYGDNKLYKVACGANVDDYNWTEVVVRNAHWMMDGISLHYYTIPGESWSHKGSATEFDEQAWYSTMKKALHMDTLVTKHSEIINRYDPNKRIGLIVDEWGSWYDVEPGTNPGFLYQQNTMRDALIAGIHLNIFNQHSDRVTMANLAQTANVLQSVVLTKDDKMVLTPTYHVFDMYKEHMDATLLESSIATEKIEQDMPLVHQCASIAEDGTMTVTLCNLSLDKSAEISADILGFKPTSAQGQLLCGNMTDHNTFDEPDKVTPTAFEDIKLSDTGFTVNLPACSVASICISQ